MTMAKVKEKESRSEEENGKEEPSFSKKKVVFILVRLVLSATLAALAYFLFKEETYGLALNLTLNLLAWAVCAYDLVYQGFKNTLESHNPFDENVLMTIASIGAFCLRCFGPDYNEFVEAVMVVFLYQIGEVFEDVATEKSHQAIKNAVGLRAKYANKLQGNDILSVSPESLQIGDEILIKVGEIVPADGTLIEGKGNLDMSSLTGEFLPVEKHVGDFINSGTILKSGSLKIRVDKAYADSTVSKILKLVDDSAKSKSHADRFITKFARIYTPIVVGISFLVAVLPPLFLGVTDSAVWFRWLYTAICFLVISCPCAVVISVPLAYFSGIGLASKHGIVIKGAAYFDKLNELGVLVSDKTGTLTYGDFRISKVVPVDVDEGSFAKALRAAECRSDHPLAKAILKGADPGEISAKVTSYEEIAGQGEKCVYEGQRILAGRKELLEKEGISVPEVTESGSLVYLAIDGRYHGYVVLNDVIRKESKELIDGCKRLRVKTVMLTGDKSRSAEAVASTLGIEECHSELLPQEKTDLLKEKINETDKSVAYIGDGINDAPSIILADVGVAMGGVGSDMSIDSADVVIMNDDPSKVVTALEIARYTRRRAIEDIIIALSVKLAIMICALFVPNFPLLLAVLADTGLTLVLVVFSLLLLYKKVR
jgi:Cd2+/Zn2+-exporting ATPase